MVYKYKTSRISHSHLLSCVPANIRQGIQCRHSTIPPLLMPLPWNRNCARCDIPLYGIIFRIFIGKVESCCVQQYRRLTKHPECYADTINFRDLVITFFICVYVLARDDPHIDPSCPDDCWCESFRGWFIVGIWDGHHWLICSNLKCFCAAQPHAMAQRWPWCWARA